MKKISLSFVLFFLLVIFNISSFAASQGELVVSNANGKPGETVSVTISIKNNPGIIAMRLNVDYDNTQISLVEVSDGKLLGSGNASFNNNINAVPYTLLWEDALATENYNQDGVLATLKFKILDSASPGKVDIKINVDAASTFNKDLIETTFFVSDATISISSDYEQTTRIAQTKTEIEKTSISDSTHKTTSYSTSSRPFSVCKHHKTEWITLKEPTCNMEGKKKMVCHDCGLVLKVENMMIKEHSMSEWKISHKTGSGNTIETRCCIDCAYQETRELAENGTVIVVYNNSEELTHSSSETNTFEQIQQSDQLVEENEQSSKTTTEPQKGGEKESEQHNNTLIIIFVIAVLLIVISVLLIVFKHKKEKV